VATARPTKAERKEQARVEREQIQHRMDAKRKRRNIGLVLVVVGVVLAAVALFVVLPNRANSGPLPGMLTTPAPWSNNVEELEGRLDRMDLPGLSEVVNHIHSPVSIVVEGQPVTIPANVGIDQASGVISPIHTHDETGTVHVEADDAAFVGTLGEVFDVWGVRFTGDCLGGYCTGGDAALRVFVDGEEVTGDPRAVPLEDGVPIVVTYGTEDQLPDSVAGGDGGG
jgi:hypothetical protein